MNKTSILIDRGTRRIGDFYAACLLLARFNQIRQIRFGGLVDRKDADIIIGLSGRFEPSDLAMTFDTPKAHRNGPGNPLGLVLTHLGYYDTASYVWPWLYPLEIREAHGTAALVEHLNCGHEVIGKLTSPLEAAIFEDFLAACPLTEEHVLFGEMIRYGEFMLNQITAAETIDQWVEKNHRMLLVGDLSVLWVPSLPPAPIEQAVNRLMLRQHPEAACSVIPDHKGTGLTFFRFSFHHAKLDFTKAQTEFDVCFCNPNGSLLKTSDRFDDVRNEEIIRRIITRSTT